MPLVKPMIIGIWSGFGKPDCLTEYLGPFMRDIHFAIWNGIEVNGNRIEVGINSFICDSPARCWLKGRHLLLNIHQNIRL